MHWLSIAPAILIQRLFKQPLHICRYKGLKADKEYQASVTRQLATALSEWGLSPRAEEE